MEKSKAIRNDYIFIASIYALCIYVWVSADQFPKATIESGFGAGMYPMLLAVLMGFFNTILLIKNVFNSKKSQAESEQINAENKNTSEEKKTFTVNKPTGFGICIFIYAIVIKYIGFLVSSFLMVFALTQIMGAEKKRSVLVSLGAAVIVYVLFKVVLKVSLPTGTVFGG